MIQDTFALDAPLVSAPGLKRDRFHDDYRALAVGSFPHDYGARGEYHAILPRGERGGWYEPVWRPDWSHPRWAVLVDSGERELAHSNRRREVSLLVRETGEWRDPRITAPVRLLSARTRLGLLFGYLDSRRHGRLVLGADELEIEWWEDGKVSRLGLSPLTCPIGEPLPLWIENSGAAIRAGLGDRVALEARLPAVVAGRVGIWTDGPARFGPFDVEGALSDSSDAERGPLDGGSRPDHPAAFPWRRIPTAGFGTGRQLRFGDLDGDGRLEMLLPQHAKLAGADDHAMITALTAIDLDGRVRWTWGSPTGDPEAMRLCADLPCQIHDLDGDGKAEIVFASGFRLRVLDGATGRELRSMPMPPPHRVPESRRLAARLSTRFHQVVLSRLIGRLGLPLRAAPWFPWPEDSTWRIRGDAIAFCDVSGVGRATDLIIKDRYSHLWVYDREFRLLWSSEHNTGHFPSFLDLDGDGKDEVLSGFRLLTPDGATRWARDDLRDHADAVAMGRESGNRGAAWVAMVAGDEGFLLLDEHGRSRVRRLPGHAQRLGIGRFRADLPGAQFWIGTYWGGAGIRALYDREGRTLHRSETPGRGQVLIPTHWTAGDADLALVSADPRHGGLIDGHGRTVVRLPDDGHPSECCAAVDLTGDHRHEIVCWDGESIAIYAAADGELKDPGPRRACAPLFNASNYRAEVSWPAASANDRGGTP